MSRKSSAVFIFAALAIGVLVLFGLSGDVSATTIKLNYSTAYDCGGADGVQGNADDSCSTAGLGGRALSATADVVTVFDIKVGHSNYANTRTVLASPAFTITPGGDLGSGVLGIPDGAFIGTLTTMATLSLLGAACVSSVPVTIPFFDASTDITDTIDWTGDGSNLTVDGTGNGLADGIDKYPSFLNVMFYNQKPLARYYGYTVATGTIPTQLNFVIFAPGVLAGTSGAPGMPKPDQEMNAGLGYINYVALNNPAPGQPAAPITITDLCTPLNVTTRLLGKTAGEGESIAPVGNPELSAQCTGALAGKDSDNDGDGKEGGGTVAGEDCDDLQDDDSDGKIDCADFDCQPYCDDGCIVVNDTCGDGIDNDFDGKVDEYCVGTTGTYEAVTRSKNPTTATSGIYGSGTHLAGAYLQGYRDADSDGIENNLDSCPTIADGRESGAACTPGTFADDDGDTKINDGCPRIGTAERFPTPDECAELPGTCVGPLFCDDDSDTLANDGCPAVQKDTGAGGTFANNGVGDACETPANCPQPPSGTATDCDGDLFLNRQDNCPLVSNASQFDLDSNRCNDAVNSDAGDDVTTPQTLRINDGCPAVGAPETACTDAVDSDIPPDGVVNDGCPLRGGISEFAVVTTDPNVGVNDGCAQVGGEAELLCADALDNDPSGGDGVVNDGCPTVGARKDCDSSIPADADCVDTGEAAACLNALDDDGDAPNDFGPASDSIGDACDANATAVDGDYDKDFPRVAVCIGAADSDAPSGDGWCDATETALGSNPAAAASIPEFYGIDYPIDPAPQSCSNNLWYASSGDPIGDGAVIDDDGDTLVNNAPLATADPGCLPASGAAWDPDLDGIVSSNPCTDPITTHPVTADPLRTVSRTMWLASPPGPAGDLCLVYNSVANYGAGWWSLLNDATVTVNPAGCGAPTVTVGALSDGNEGIRVVWPDKCVDPGETVVVTFRAVTAPANQPAPSGEPCALTIWTDPGVPLQVDNCPSVYNPDQTNSDTLAIGGGDASGDACDLNDDGDGLIDTAEWTRGSDARHPFSPFMLDIDGNTAVQGADASALKAWIGTSIGTLPPLTQVCLQ